MVISRPEAGYLGHQSHGAGTISSGTTSVYIYELRLMMELGAEVLTWGTSDGTVKHRCRRSGNDRSLGGGNLSGGSGLSWIDSGSL